MPDMEYVQTRREGPVLVVTLTNPPRNFMNGPMVLEMAQTIDAVERDAEVRAIVFTGGVDGIFITHYDVGELSRASDTTREQVLAPREPSRHVDLHPLNKLLLQLQTLPQPVIAAINGTAMGGGCEFTLACDFRIMARGYQIGLPEVRVGILPGAGGTQRMARLLGTAKALELMLLGNTVDADTAASIGLVHRAVDKDRVLPEAMALANELASRPRLSVALIKKCVIDGVQMPLEEGLRLEQRSFSETMRSDDASRLMRAYLTSERPLNEQ
ncbi:MAG: enoyl-CoA hydratase/isomerase family protein [Dehalococcoidia bacterium]